jgi:Clp amino terminal domain, pathogenicity island component
MSTPPVRLDELIEHVKNKHPNGDALRWVSDAVLVSEHLGELADHLVGHFVDQARRTGASWTDIGRSMGVTKQAAQKRFVPRQPEQSRPGDAGGIFGRFSGSARRVVVEAQEQARAAGNHQIGTEHLVLGLVRVPDTLAVEAIEALGVTLEAVRAAAAALLDPPDKPVNGHLPFGTDAKRILDLTARETLRLGHDFVSTGHILLALFAHTEGRGARALTEAGLSGPAIEEWVVAALAAGRGED